MDRKDIDISLSRQTAFDVTAPDGKKIFVYCNRAGDTPSKKAIVIGHGLSGSPNAYMHLMARNYFNALGYDVYRMAFYWDESYHRKLHETTLAIQGQDLNSVIAHVRDAHDKLYVCGHSYGGLTLVFANPQVNAMSFWDSSYQPWDRMWVPSTTPATDGKTHLLHWEHDITIGQQMMDEAKALTRDAASLMTRQIVTPSQVMVAGDAWMKVDTQMLYDDLTCVKEKHVVQGAGHMFAEGQVIYELLDKTHEWFKKF
jgi:hypothetical protein